MRYKTIAKIIALSLLLPVISQATEYDLTQSTTTTYDEACDSQYGCYDMIATDDGVANEQTLNYVISTDQKGNPLTAFSENRIDDKLIKSEQSDYTPTDRLLGNRTYYGANNRLVAEKTYDYDVYVRIFQETVKNYDDNEKLYQTNYLTHEYDGWNIDQEVQKTLTSSQPGEFKNYRKTYDVLGRVVGLSYTLNGKTYQTSSQYDGADRMVVGKDFNTNVMDKIYDNNGHLAQTVTNGVISSMQNGVTSTQSDSQEINYQYDNYARLQQNSLDNRVLAYAYNSIGLQKNQSVMNASNAQNTQDFTYDGYNRLKSYTDYNGMTYNIYYKPDSEIDHVTVSSDTLNGTMTPEKYGYDDSVGYWQKGKPHVITIDLSFGGHTLAKIATISYYSPSEATYAIEIGQKKSVHYQVKQDGVIVSDLTVTNQYDDRGRIIKEQYSETSGDNNLNKTTDYTYDPLDRLQESVTTFTGSTGLQKQTITYSYNINGDITTRVQTDVNKDGTSKTMQSDYVYNEIDQLVSKTDTVTTA
ncbi:RHS repeat domain-containing protein [Facilibium subflavum]|uniref:hypothetical protein n=1 Tax=Facilibium subflavum TaxID=2219058 RepID=UPI000E654F77|nr:hypothetical protein [Facilibium subflavum]